MGNIRQKIMAHLIQLSFFQVNARKLLHHMINGRRQLTDLVFGIDLNSFTVITDRNFGCCFVDLLNGSANGPGQVEGYAE
ncbi:hypothetical protein D3C85_1719300 [compost metagenome]